MKAPKQRPSDEDMAGVGIDQRKDVCREEGTAGIADGFRRRVTRERLVLAVAGLTAAAAVFGGIAAAAVPGSATTTVALRTVAATSISPSSTTAGSTRKAGLCGPLLLVVKRDYDRLPDAMHKDIVSAIHQSPGSAKHDALQNVLKKAQSGGYGSAVAAAAKGKKSLAGFKAAWDRLPSAFRGDLKKARSASGDTRVSDLKAIVSKAESGGYGDRVKGAADKVKTRLDKCVARVQGKDSGSHSGATGSPSAPSTGTPSTPKPSTPKPSTPMPSTPTSAPTSTNGA